VTALLEVGSSEELALFNPAFLARLLHGVTTDYENAAHVGMPASLAFLLLPLVLHKPTREDLPSLASAQMQKWIREHPQHMAGLDVRVQAMRTFVGLAIRFGLRHALLVSSEGRISAGSVKRRPAGFRDLESAEVHDCLRVSKLLGRWFARQPDAPTLLAFWGLRP
jgi:hypothetical protein